MEALLPDEVPHTSLGASDAVSERIRKLKGCTAVGRRRATRLTDHRKDRHRTPARAGEMDFSEELR